MSTKCLDEALLMSTTTRFCAEIRNIIAFWLKTHPILSYEYLQFSYFSTNMLWILIRSTSQALMSTNNLIFLLIWSYGSREIRIL